MENSIKLASGDLLLFHKWNETGYQKTSLELSQDGDIQLTEVRECTSFVSLDEGNPVQITRYLVSMLDLIEFVSGVPEKYWIPKSVCKVVMRMETGLMEF